jgi:hypothetical protein
MIVRITRRATGTGCGGATEKERLIGWIHGALGEDVDQFAKAVCAASQASSAVSEVTRESGKAADP